MTQDGARPRSRPLEGTVLGRYRLVRWLGEGGMGAVYEATHQELGKRAAVKTLHERLAAAPEARQRFLREGKAAARIRHTNVADVYDVGLDGEHPYLVMELLEGEDLGRWLARRGALPVQECADLLVPVVAAVAAAHDLGIVHRDLKPENIFLTRERGGLTPKVLDFGISKLGDADAPSALTGTGALLGTPHYMSPEQARGDKQIDARSDQYALGVILYQCVTGRRPLQGVPLYSLIQRTVHGDFPPPRQLHPALPSAFEALILQAMARQPDRRFASTRALGQALLAFASGAQRSAYGAELGGAPPPSPPLAAPALSTTLGESAHVRAVPGPKPRWRRRLAIGAALLLAAGLGGWRLLAQRASSPTEVLAATPTAQRPVHVAAAPASTAPATPAEPAPAEPAAPAAPARARIQTGKQGRPIRSNFRSAKPALPSAEAAAPVPKPAPLPSDDPEDGFVDLSSSSGKAR
jgi:serine/threonine-protein kinase